MLDRPRRPASLLLAALLLAQTPGPGFQAVAAAFERPAGRAVELPALPVAPGLPAAAAVPMDFRSGAEISLPPAAASASALPAAPPSGPSPVQSAVPAEISAIGRNLPGARSRPAGAVQAAQAARAARAAAAPRASAESGRAGFEAVFSGASSGGAADEAEAVAAPSDSAPELETQTLDVSSYSGLKARLKKAFGALPPDAHRAPARGRRYRAAAELEIRPLADGRLDVRATPGATFLDKSAEARLPGIAAEVVKDAQFRTLVESLYARLPQAVRARGVRVSVHQMRVEDGAVTEGPHQDPHADYLAVWAVGRRNAKGGESVLSTPDGRTTLRRTLGPDEILLFDNRTLFHDATALARRAPWRRSRRDALVLAFAALPPAAAALTEADRSVARGVIAEELGKAVPDAARLKPIYETGDPQLQRALFRGFKRWSRFFSFGDGVDGSLWKLVKGSAAPWAGHVYVKKLVSVLEFLGQARGDQRDAEKKAQEIHAADHAFSKAFVEAAEKRTPQGLDEEETADAISDSVIYPALIQPFMERRVKGAFDRKAVVEDVARRLKETAYLYSSMSVEDIRQLLSQPDVLERLDNLIDLLEDELPDDPRGPAASSAAKLPARKSRRLSGGAAMGLALLAATAAMHAFTGHGVELAPLAALAVGALRDTAAAPRPGQPQASDDAAQPPTPAGDGLSPFLVDLTQLARRGEIPPIYLRDDETAKTIQILNQKNYNNVVLIGEPGVGKTAIAEGLALRIAAGKTGTPLDGQRVLLLDIGRFMAAAAGSPDAFASAVEEVVKEAADGNTTLVIDEAHQLARDPDQPAMGMGSFFDQIKRVMTQGRLKLILATTRDEYNRFFARDRALESRSQVIFVEPVAEGPAMELLYRIRGQFENGVQISFGAAKAAVELTVRAFRFDALLRMAIKAMDTAATRLRVRPALVRSRLLDTRKDLLYHLELLREARASGDVERQENLVPQVQALVDRAAELHDEILKPARTEVTREDVAESLQELGAPVHSLKAGTQEYIEGVDRYLRANLIGHDALVDATIAAIKRRFAQPNLRKPIFSAVLLGPTGTGKTEFARLLARGLFGIKDFDKDAIKIDGGAHQHSHDIARIQGSPPGYVGFGATETLMDQVRRKPESIILVDEVEKMHPDILNLFLSILEDGSAKDAFGRPVDFSHTVILFTSNYGVPPGDYEKLSDADFIAHVREQLKKPFPLCPFKPELLNRPSLVDVFTPLKAEEVRRIVELRVDKLVKSWHDLHGVDVSFADREAAIQTLLKEGFDPRNGARPVNRAVDARLEAPLSELLLSRALQRGDRVTFQPDWSTKIDAASADRRVPGLGGATPESRALAERLEALLADASAPLTMDEVDQALDAALPDAGDDRLAARAPAPGLAAAETRFFDDHRPGAADPKLKEALEALKTEASRPGFDAEPLAKAVKALVQKAKRLDLEAEARKAEGAHWTRGFEEMEKEAGELQGPAKTALQKRLQELVEAAGKSRKVSLSWRVSDDAVVAAVRADARLTYEEEDKLLWVLASRSAEGPARLENARDGALEQARKDAAAAGGRLGWSRDQASATLWLEWPLPRKTQAAEPAAAPTAAPAAPVAAVAPVAAEPAPAAAPAPSAAPAAPAAPAPPEPARRPRPPRADDRSLDAERQALAKKAGLLTDTQYTDREVAVFGRELEQALRERPELASPELEEALWRGLLAFSKYVDELRRNGHQMEDIAVDVGQSPARPALRFREFYRLYRELLAARPDLAPEDAREKLATALSLGHVAPGRGYYYDLDQRGAQAMLWVWQQMVETAFALSAERPRLVSQEWLEAQLARDARWQSYALERQAVRLREPATGDAEAVELGNGLAAALAKEPKRATAALVEDLYEAMDSARAGTAVPERSRAAARLALALAEVRPELAGPRVTELLKQWLSAQPEPATPQAWLGEQGVELGLMLERKKSGLSPWKEMEARLKDDPRWKQLVLIRHAAVLADGGAEAAIEAANELGRTLAERPQDATPELAELLWKAVDANVQKLNAERTRPADESLVTLVGGRAMPLRRARESYELYRKLLEARPDLIPADFSQRLKKELQLARVQEWRPSSYEGLYRHDARGSQAAHWAIKQLEEMALVASAKRPDLLTMKDMLDLYDQAVKHRRERHSFSVWGVWAIVVSGIWTALFPILRFGNDVKVPLWTWGLAAAPVGAYVAFNVIRALRERPAYAALSQRLRQDLLRRMEELPPIDTLRAIAAFDQETGRWHPNAGRAELFKDLLRRPDFKQEAEGKGLGRAVDGDEKRLRELAATLGDVQVPADTARDAGQRLEASLREHPEAADADLEAVLRRAVDAAAERVTAGKEALVTLPGARPAPSLRSRLVVEVYAQLLRARPELAGPEARATLQKMLSTSGTDDHRSASGWLQEQAAGLASALDAARPGYVRAQDAHVFYTESLRSAQFGRDGFRSRASAAARLTFAIVGTLLAALATGAHLLWHPGGFWFWALAVLGGAGALSGALAWPLWLTQRLRAGRGAAKLDAALEAQLAASLRRGEPRAALDLVGELDAERGVWFAKPGQKKVFDRLSREWPEFRAAAGLDKK